MVVESQGRNNALEGGPLRDPPLEDAARVVPTITTAGVQVFEVQQEQAYELNRAGLFDADDVILFEHVSADVVFEPPPELAAWLSEIETAQSSSPPVDEAGQSRAWRPPLLPSIAASATLLTAVGLSLGMRLRRRARVRREMLLLALDRLENGYEACAGDPDQDPGMSQGYARDRKIEVETQLALVRGVMERDLGTYRSHPCKLRQEDVLRPVAEKLSRRLARLERAENELEVMVEVKRVIDRLDSGDLLCEDRARGGFRPADDGGLGWRRGEGGDSDTGDGGGGSGEQSARLASRVKALRDAATADDNGIARKPLCVFPDDLDRCFADLEEKELDATDALKEGLERWDLGKVDGALTKLKLLGRLDLVTKFRANRQEVRAKIERLRKELKEPQGNRRTKEYVSSLSRACVKAETFSATCLPEYETAKLALEDARTNQLRAQAQQTFAAHMTAAEPHLVKRLVGGLKSASVLTLLPRDLQDEYLESGGGVVSSDDVGSVGGAERSASMAEDGVEHLSSDQGEGRNGDGHGRGDAWAESALPRGSPFVSVGGGVETSGRTTGTYGPTTLGNRVVAGNAREQMLSLRVGYQSAAVEINALQIRLDERHEDECLKIRMALEERERKEAADNVRFAQQEAANRIRQKDLEMKKRAAEAAEKERECIRAEVERKKVDDRRRSLRSADNDFFRLLGLASAFVTVATAAARKGVSLSSSTPLEAVWWLVTAECREGGGNGGALACDPTSATCSATCSAGSGTLSGYGDLCAVGSGDAVAGSDDGYLGGTSSADTLFWWVLSAASSATGAITKAGGSAVGWLLGEALGLVVPVEQCEVYAVLSLVLWLCSLFVVMKVTGLVAGEVRGPVGAAIRSIVFGLWVWGRFHDWLLTTSQEVLLVVAPAPVLVLVYAGALRWFEQKPESCWQMGEYDLRPAVSRVVPAVVACALALFGSAGVVSEGMARAGGRGGRWPAGDGGVLK